MPASPPVRRGAEHCQGFLFQPGSGRLSSWSGCLMREDDRQVLPRAGRIPLNRYAGGDARAREALTRGHNCTDVPDRTLLPPCAGQDTPAPEALFRGHNCMDVPGGIQLPGASDMMPQHRKPSPWDTLHGCTGRDARGMVHRSAIPLHWGMGSGYSAIGSPPPLPIPW